MSWKTLTAKSRAAAPVTAAILVVSCALAGGAIAANNQGNASDDSAAAAALTKKQVKKIAKKVAKKQIKKAAPGLTVAHAKTADSATTANTAATANLLNGFAASDLARVTSASAGNPVDPCNTAVLDDFNSTEYTTLVGRNVTAPKAGILLLTATISAEEDSNFSGESRSLIRLVVDGAQAGGAGEITIEDTFASGCGDAKTTTIQAVVPVAAGTHSIASQIQFDDGSGRLFVGFADISSLYVPFGNAGQVGVPASGADNN